MPIIELPCDLNEIEGQIKPISTPGVYPAELEKVITGKTSGAGHPVIMFVGKWLDGPEGVVGEKFMMTLSLQEQALWKLRQLRDVIGAPATDGRRINTDDYIGVRLRMAAGLKDVANKDGVLEQRTDITDFMPYA